MDEWIDGCMNGWMDGSMEGRTTIESSSFLDEIVIKQDKQNTRNIHASSCVPSVYIMALV